VSEAASLAAIETGERAGPTLVFLHGFDGRKEIFRDLAEAFAGEGFHCLAFDLPGHGQSLEFPGFGPPKIAARAVLAELERRDIREAHLVGHSMGGAVACLAALFAPERVRSLTLLAPGGFGSEIGLGPIRAVMEAEDEAAYRRGMAMMMAPGGELPADFLIERGGSEQRRAIRQVFDLLFGSGRQGVLPLDAIAGVGCPIRVLWGEDDPVTPVEQCEGLPAAFRVTRLPETGHMLMLEAFEACREIIEEAIRDAEGAQPG